MLIKVLFFFYLYLYMVYKRLFIIYLFIIILLIILPINGKESRINHIYVLKMRLDHIFHAMLFAPWMFFYEQVKPLHIFKNLNVLKWLFTGIVFCIFAECLQYVIPYRAFNINDMLANCIGVMLGLAAFVLTRSKKINSETVNN